MAAASRDRPPPPFRQRHREARARRRSRARTRLTAQQPVARARALLRAFRKASVLAVALTSLILLVVEPKSATAEAPGATVTQSSPVESSRSSTPNSRSDREGLETARVAQAAGDEAKRAFSELKQGAFAALPKLAVVTGLLVGAWIAVRLSRTILRRALRDWPRANALLALFGVAMWSVAIGISVTVIAGDVRAFLGSVGLLGLAASWALQTPIESFTGWLLNAFKGYYRVGDRVEVGELFGDVYRIDVLTTTIWEIGSPFRPGFVHGEQPTGRLVTFPNNQVLTGSVVNLTRDFPYLWDELSVSVANESDLRYAIGVFEKTANELLVERMQKPAQLYESVLQREGIQESVPDRAQVFVSPESAWTNLHLRYLVQARQRRGVKTELVLRLADELKRPEHAGRIIPVLPRQQLQFIAADGTARDAQWFAQPHSLDSDPIPGSHGGQEPALE